MPERGGTAHLLVEQVGTERVGGRHRTSPQHTGDRPRERTRKARGVGGARMQKNLIAAKRHRVASSACGSQRCGVLATVWYLFCTCGDQQEPLHMNEERGAAGACLGWLQCTAGGAGVFVAPMQRWGPQSCAANDVPS